MIRCVFTRISARRRHAALMVAREIADRELHKAVLSGDTQSIHEARQAMRAATHAQMKSELEMRK